MRLQVFLSKSGISSRRAAAWIIRSGRIKVDDKIVLEPSFKVDPDKDRIFLDNRRLFAKEKIYIVLNKPMGVTSTKKDRHAESTIMDLLPQNLRHLNPVGRLDKDSTGLILLTNDGALINRFTHPSFNINKQYLVTLDKALKDKDRRNIEGGVVLDNKATAPCKIRLRGAMLLEVTIGEGRKRQIRRMFSGKGYRVLKLKRVKEGPLGLGELPAGKWRFLTKKEISAIKSHST